MVINGIPKTEKVWEEIITQDGSVYYITSKENDRSYYSLYKIDNNNAVKLGKAKSPTDLENKYINKEK